MGEIPTSSTCMSDGCAHMDGIGPSEPNTTEGCEESLEAGLDGWVELRVCTTCRRVGCCGSSPGTHAAGHFEEAGHELTTPQESDDGVWCYDHETYG